MIKIVGGPKGDLELEALQSGAVAKTAKSAWETQAKADKAGSTQPRGPIDIGLPTGGVKERMSKIVAGGEELEESDDENESDPNIVKSSKKKKTKEELNVQVGNLKSKWEEGKVETAETTDADPDRAAELQSLKGASVKERFKERTANDKDETQRASKLPEDLVNCKPSFTNCVESTGLACVGLLLNARIGLACTLSWLCRADGRARTSSPSFSTIPSTEDHHTASRATKRHFHSRSEFGFISLQMHQ